MHSIKRKINDSVIFNLYIKLTAMRISHTIDLNTLTAYETSPNVFTRRGRLKCDEFSWDLYSVQSLRELCIIAISINWEHCPLYNELEILADRTLLVDILPCNLPLHLTIPILENDSYWQRCFFNCWPGMCPSNRYLTCRSKKIESVNESLDDEDTNDVEAIEKSNDEKLVQSNTTHSSSTMSNPLVQYIRSNSRVNNYAEDNIVIRKTWKQCFVEKYVQEELEEMSPDMFNPEYIKELTDLCGSYLISLHLRQLKHTADNTDHISLHSLLARLLNLIEFSICFNQANLGDNFSWQAMKISEIDCELLGNGVEKSKIEILRVLRSFIDCNKLKLIIRPLTTHRYIQVLDFSHCKIRDEGALALVALLKENVNIKNLILVNNRIGPAGAEGFGCYLSQGESTLVELNLKLNPIKSEGGKAISTALADGAKSLRILSLSACGLTSENIHIANALALNTTLQKLDLSNNHLGENVGLHLLNQLDTITTLLDIDVRMCDFAPDIVNKIQTKVENNTKQSRGLLEVPVNTESRVDIIDGTKKRSRQNSRSQMC